jgi:hypothetical protein
METLGERGLVFVAQHLVTDGEKDPVLGLYVADERAYVCARGLDEAVCRLLVAVAVFGYSNRLISIQI